MKERNANFAVVSALLFIAIGVGPTLYFGGCKRTMAQENSSRANTHSLVEKARSDGYRNTTIYPKPERRYDDVTTLVNESAAVVVGVVKTKQSKFQTAANSYIVTDYMIAVRQTLKGNLQTGDTVTVRVPGGTVQIDDQTRVEMSLPAYWKLPQIGQKYVLFLVPRRGGKETQFTILGGPQGLFAISTQNLIMPQVRPNDLLMQKNKNKNAQLFFHEIRRVQADR